MLCLNQLEDINDLKTNVSELQKEIQRLTKAATIDTRENQDLKENVQVHKKDIEPKKSEIF